MHKHDSPTAERRDAPPCPLEGLSLWYRVNMKTSMVIESPMNAEPRRRATTTGTLVGTRFQATLLEAIDSWRKDQADLPTRPEAVRRLVELGMNCGTAPFNGSSVRRAKRNSDDKI